MAAPAWAQEWPPWRGCNVARRHRAVKSEVN